MKDLSNENVIHINNNGMQFLQFRSLLKYSDKIKHAYSLGIDKNYRTGRINSKLDRSDLKSALNFYNKLCKSANMDFDGIVKCGQRHTDKVISIYEAGENGPIVDPEFIADGLITDKEKIVLTTTNADCILILMYDPIKNVIANIHSGWRGTVQRISVKAIEKMKNEYGCDPKDILCCICPSIRKCHFEVDKDVKDIFEVEFTDINEKFIFEKIPEMKWTIDTVIINKVILRNAGVLENNIIDSQICSVCNSDLIHSYRVEKKNFGLSTAMIEKI